MGTGIAAALGLGGTAAGGLIAAAAPKAIGAGIGTLLGGGDLGDAALNAVGFGAAGAALGGGGAAPAAAPAPAAAIAAPANPTQFNVQGLMQGMEKATQAMDTMQGREQPAPMLKTPNIQTASATTMQSNPMLSAPPPMTRPQGVSPVVPSVGGPSAMPASLGIGALPAFGQTMSDTDMSAGLSPGQRNLASQFLASRGMTGFA
tara:strand:+ start:1752 stop:2363 length:612 start_codon:yes stop_codon:yes gene_type:complete